VLSCSKFDRFCDPTVSPPQVRAVREITSRKAPHVLSASNADNVTIKRWDCAVTDVGHGYLVGRNRTATKPKERSTLRKRTGQCLLRWLDIEVCNVDCASLSAFVDGWTPLQPFDPVKCRSNLLKVSALHLASNSPDEYAQLKTATDCAAGFHVNDGVIEATLHQQITDNGPSNVYKPTHSVIHFDFVFTSRR